MSSFTNAWRASPATAAVVLSAVGAATLFTMVPRPAFALAPSDLAELQAALSEKEVARALDANEREIQTKFLHLVETQFDGSYGAAFAHYDRNADQGIDRSELIELLEDASVGTLFTRGRWADGVLDKVDKKLGNRDGRIQWSEFQKVITAIV